MKFYFEDDPIDKYATWVMFASFFVYIIWLIAKTIGWINTPIWLQYLPLYVLVPVILGFFMKAGRFLEKFDRLINDVDELRADMREIRKEARKNTLRITKLEAKVF